MTDVTTEDRRRAAAMMRDVWPSTWSEVSSQAKTIYLDKMAVHFARARENEWNKWSRSEAR